MSLPRDSDSKPRHLRTVAFFSGSQFTVLVFSPGVLTVTEENALAAIFANAAGVRIYVRQKQSTNLAIGAGGKEGVP